MARISGSRNDSIFSISKWHGVNESTDGDTNLRMGEASTMTNFKITDDGSLQKRPGTQVVSTLLAAYTATVATTATLIATETVNTTFNVQAYPSISVTPDGGILQLSGTPVTVNYLNFTSYQGYYCQYNGGFYKIGTCQYTPTAGQPITGGYVVYGSQQGPISVLNGNTGPHSLTIATGINVVNNAVALVNPYQVSNNDWPTFIGKYALFNGTIYYVNNAQAYGDPYSSSPTYVSIWGQPVTAVAPSTYNWNFYVVSVSPNTTESHVRGIWSGRVGGSDVICAACNGHLWKLAESGGTWTRASLGTLDTSRPVHMFGFGGNLYVMNGIKYYSWDGGAAITEVDGYVPLVSVSVPPAGGGTALQRINMLTGKRRIWVSPDGTATTFKLPEACATVDYAKSTATGAAITVTASNPAAGTVSISPAPAAGTNTIEIGYTVSTNFRSQILAMTLSEQFNGVTDNRVFIYGDGSSKAFYSDLDYNGIARADYFPDLNVVHIGDANTPITSMIRHYDRLLAFKTDSAYSIAYDTITLVDGKVTAGFYVTTINKGLGSAGYGQAVIVGNQPRTLDGRSIYEWTATTSSGNITSDQRNAQRISQKVQRTLREINLEQALTYHDKINHEYFIVHNGIAIVQNTENGTWYIYRDFPAVCMIVYKDELYFGTATGALRHVSRNYMHDCGVKINCYWESGSMDFGVPYGRKYSDSLWVVLKPEDDANVFVTVQTDKQSDYADQSVIENYTDEVSTGFFSFLNLDFAHFTFNINDKPHTQRRKLKVKNFAWYKLIFSTATNDTTATILSTSIKVRQIGIVR